jgi:hypothetical protein
MTTERTLYKYLVRSMGFSLRQANLFMCKAHALSQTRRAAGYWNNIPGSELRLLSHKFPARLACTLCYYLACNFFAAAKRAPWAEHQQSCYNFIIKCTHLPDDPVFFLIKTNTDLSILPLTALPENLKIHFVLFDKQVFVSCQSIIIFPGISSPV